MTQGVTPAFLDGDDLCAGCGACCRDIDSLRLTEAEVERLPLLAPFVTRREGPFLLLDVEGPCPYLRDDGRCGTFATRPFDCSLYPVNLSTVGVRRADGRVEVRWDYTANRCPERPEIVHRANRTDLAPVTEWVRGACGATEVQMVHTGRAVAERVNYVLHRLGLLRLARRLAGRAPLPTKPGSTR